MPVVLVQGLRVGVVPVSIEYSTGELSHWNPNYKPTSAREKHTYLVVVSGAKRKNWRHGLIRSM